MHCLEVIGLSGNMLTAIPPLAPLTRLRSLNISSNKITALPADILLYVSSFIPSFVCPTCLIFVRLPNLEVLTATHNQLTDLPELILPTSPLLTLDLRSNKFKSIPTVISNMKLLSVANFSYNNVRIFF
jgi:Leucine-rich repeat (LRR) protein